MESEEYISVNIARRVDSPGRRYAGPPSLLRKEGRKFDKNIPSPLYAQAKRGRRAKQCRVSQTRVPSRQCITIRFPSSLSTMDYGLPPSPLIIRYNLPI
jgi:hypothetical protein